MTQTDPLTHLLTDDHVALKLRAASKPALLTELARRAAALTGLSEATLAAALAARESLGSTGFGAGIAVPHARIDGLSGVFGFLARLDKPVAYEAIDGKPVDLIFLLLSPTSANRTVADAIRNAATPTTARSLLTH
jgi:PTS system nitrogen regulatory IIA component